jgi:hypothetical protein
MPEDLLVQLGARIKKLHKKRGWTQVEMAERVGVDRSFLAGVAGQKECFNPECVNHCEGTRSFPLTAFLRGCRDSSNSQHGLDEHRRPIVGLGCLALQVYGTGAERAPEFWPHWEI